MRSNLDRSILEHTFCFKSIILYFLSPSSARSIRAGILLSRFQSCRQNLWEQYKLLIHDRRSRRQIKPNFGREWTRMGVCNVTERGPRYFRCFSRSFPRINVSFTRRKIFHGKFMSEFMRYFKTINLLIVYLLRRLTCNH